MAVALLKDPPIAPSADLGPYRRADYDALPDEPRCELIFGRIYVSPSPTPFHQLVVALLWQWLDAVAEPGALVLFAPLDVILADHSVVQPDVVYVSAARRDIVGRRIEGAPDLLIEVLSPGSGRRDRGEKLALYASSGVREYWIVDPAERQIELLVNEEGRFVVALPVGGGHRPSVLSDARFDVAAFWDAVDRKLS